MGLYNRDYSRYNDSGGFSGWTQESPVTAWLIGTTVTVFVLQLLSMPSAQTLSHQPLLDHWLALSPDGLRRGYVWQLLTYAFCHDVYFPLHILFNMMILWSFGPMLERSYRSQEFLAFYLSAAVFAGLGQVLAQALIGDSTAAVGASGAIMGVIVLITMTSPRLPISLFGFITLELWQLVVVLLVLDLAPAIMIVATGQYAGGTAYFAHLAGMLFGYLYHQFHMNFSGFLDSAGDRLRSVSPGNWAKLARNRQRRKQLKIVEYEATIQSDLDEQVDRLLQKISEQGESSLTAEERRILEQASRAYRSRV